LREQLCDVTCRLDPRPGQQHDGTLARLDCSATGQLVERGGGVRASRLDKNALECQLLERGNNLIFGNRDSGAAAIPKRLLRN
jgi:hypothetical protein